MRISDWSSDVCSSDLGEDQDDSGGAQDQQVDARPELSDGEGEEDDQGEAEGESDGETDADLGEDGAEGMLPVRPNRPFSDLAPGFDYRAYTQMFDETVAARSEEHTSELQSLMRISYAVFCLKKKNKQK